MPNANVSAVVQYTYQGLSARSPTPPEARHMPLTDLCLVYLPLDLWLDRGRDTSSNTCLRSPGSIKFLAMQCMAEERKAKQGKSERGLDLGMPLVFHSNANASCYVRCEQTSQLRFRETTGLYHAVLFRHCARVVRPGSVGNAHLARLFHHVCIPMPGNKSVSPPRISQRGHVA